MGRSSAADEYHKGQNTTVLHFFQEERLILFEGMLVQLPTFDQSSTLGPHWGYRDVTFGRTPKYRF